MTNIWIVILLAIQSLWLASASPDSKARFSSSIVMSLLAVRSYELGLNTTSTPSSGKIRAVRRYFEHPHFESQLGLDLAELQADLVATAEARKFLSEACRYGLPSYDNLLFRENFVLSYDNRLKQPVWSLEHLTREKAAFRDSTEKKNHWFSADENLHEYFQTSNNDYRKSGYERGHFSPACSNRARIRYFEQCYKLSNVAPQVRHLNHGSCVWSRLERYISFLARRSKNTFIITGSLFLPIDSSLFAQRHKQPESVSYRVISPNRISVPTHFYKVFVAESFDKRFTLEAYLIPNSKAVPIHESINKFRIDIDKELPQVERLTGLRFFEILNKLRVDKPHRLQYDFDDTPTKSYGNNPKDRPFA